MPVLPDETVKVTPLLAMPSVVVTTTGPLAAVTGTLVVMLVAVQFVTVESAPLKVMLPCALPKFWPDIVTDVPTVPEVGDKLVIFGCWTVNVTPLLSRPFTRTTTGPVFAPDGTSAEMLVSLQLIGVVVVPLKVTVLDPCEAPKFVPDIVTDVPIVPDVGERLVMLGAVSTVNVLPLLSRPFTRTTTAPVLAPEGTGATMLVSLQLVGVAVVP